MRSDAAAGRSGYIHEAAVYNSDDEFLAIMIPFLIEGAEAGEPTVVAVGQRVGGLLRAALDDTPYISFHDASFLQPASAIRGYRELLASYVEHGAQRLRVVGEVPHPGTGQPWEWWARYEAVSSHVFGDFPLWALCSYDARVAPAQVLADAARTHPYLATTDGGHVANECFEEPGEFLARRPTNLADPLEATPPAIDLTGPTLPGARRAVRGAAQAGHLDDTETARIMYAVNEVVTNALCHGRPPVRLQLWTAPGRVVAAITDRGPGPADPFTGLVPPNTSTGVGLWLTHQMCSHMTLGEEDDGFTVHLVAGSPGLTR
ncbi:MAG TPA: sensor histidine kinase [Pseudonocardiaceae bacterium]|nr:sensor histidine kinase [Pseudonocardiaceae bacterium]